MSRNTRGAAWPTAGLLFPRASALAGVHTTPLLSPAFLDPRIGRQEVYMLFSAMHAHHTHRLQEAKKGVRLIRYHSADLAITPTDENFQTDLTYTSLALHSLAVDLASTSLFD